MNWRGYMLLSTVLIIGAMIGSLLHLERKLGTFVNVNGMNSYEIQSRLDLINRRACLMQRQLDAIDQDLKPIGLRRTPKFSDPCPGD